MKHNLSSTAKKQAGVYAIRNSINDKVYVGSSVCLVSRHNQHLNQLKRGVHKNDYLQNFSNKYGIDSLRFELLELCPPEKLKEVEQLWMDKHLAYERHNGFNILRLAVHNGPMSPEQKALIGHANKGKTGNKKGHVFSAETLARISAANKGKNNRTGQKYSEETRRKISESLLGKKTHSPELTRSIAIKNSRPIIQLSLLGEFIKEWISAMDIQRELGINNSAINRACKANRPTAGGFKWKFKDEYLPNADT